MKNYSVEIAQTLYRSTELKVLALDEEHAEEKALDQLRSLRREQANIDWYEKISDYNAYVTEMKESKVASD
jgi:hypothetical protein